jgi:hypothetical protein
MVIPVALAKNLYVNNSGCNNATTYANNDASNPWCTVARAAWGDGYSGSTYASPNTANTAQAGDTVLITAGTYTENGAGAGGGRWDVALNPANNGTSGNPITFRGVGTVNLRMTSGHRGPTIGADGRDYIVWDNITIDDTYNGSVSDTGPVVFHVSIGSQLINSTIQGHNGSYSDGHATCIDNYNAVRIEATTNILIKNNYISRVHDDALGYGTENQAGIMLYDSAGTVVEHNDIFDVGTGVYVKGDHSADGWPQELVVVRFNRIYDIDHTGIGLLAADRVKVYQNIIKGSYLGLRVYNFASPNSSNITLQNNVIVSANREEDAGISFGGTTNVVAFRGYNNIFYGSWVEAVNFGAAAPGDVDFEHNVYNGYDAWGSYSGAQRSFATWTGTGQDSASPASITSDPLFVDTTDYKLQGGSPAVNLGVDILDLDGDASTSDNVNAGAYITGNETIGVESNTNARIFNPRLNLIRSSLPQHTEELN